MGLPSFNTSASWRAKFQIFTHELISQLQAPRKLAPQAALPALWRAFHREVVELGKRDGLSQRCVTRREALLSKNEDAVDTTSPEQTSKPYLCLKLVCQRDGRRPILHFDNLAKAGRLRTFPLLPIIPRHLRGRVNEAQRRVTVIDFSPCIFIFRQGVPS